MSEGSEAFRSSSRGAIVTYGLARTLINACAIATLALTPQSAPAWAQSENQPVGSTTLEVATQVGSTSQRTMASEPAATTRNDAETEASAKVDPTPPAQATATPAVDPIIAAVRRLLAEPAPRAKSPGADRSAIIAFYEASGQPIWTTTGGLSKRGTSILAEIDRAADWGLDPSAFDVPRTIAAGATPDQLAATEVQISQAALLYARHARGGRVDPAAISALIDMRPRQLEPRIVLDALAATDMPDVYLTSLHPKHEGFGRLRQALLDHRRGVAKQAEDLDTEAEEPKSSRKNAARSAPKKSSPPSRSDVEQRILVNMERWRWMPENLGAFYVHDNVPEQITRVVRDGKVVLQERIVVGKPHTPTPSFSADMKYVILHPTWGVPEGIKTNEIGPMLRRASSYSGGGGWFFGGGGLSDGASRALARHDLRVAYNGREVDPDSIDWGKVDIRQFQFTQPPSGRNVLGVVKFRFPNRHDVYMHDTPEKHLFAHSTRAYSHGCMRVQNPMRLAETILAYDKGWSQSRVQGMLGQPGPIDITLEKSIPVHITYFTASVDEQDRLRLHGDLYGMDTRVASTLAGKPIPLAAQRPESKDTASDGGRREPRQKRERSAEEPRREPFNPFAMSSN